MYPQLNRYPYYAIFYVLGQTKEEDIDEINLQEQTLNIPIADIDEINLQELTLNIPIADQYVYSLIDKQKIWCLQDSAKVFMSDFDLLDGNYLFMYISYFT